MVNGAEFGIDGNLERQTRGQTEDDANRIVRNGGIARKAKVRQGAAERNN